MEAAESSPFFLRPDVSFIIPGEKTFEGPSLNFHKNTINYFQN